MIEAERVAQAAAQRTEFCHGGYDGDEDLRCPGRVDHAIQAGLALQSCLKGLHGAALAFRDFQAGPQRREMLQEHRPPDVLTDPGRQSVSRNAALLDSFPELTGDQAEMMACCRSTGDVSRTATLARRTFTSPRRVSRC